jgi:DNA-binding Lrp family transcriptional regulator
MAKSYILMNGETGFEVEVIASLKKIKGITEVHGILGLYDIIAKIELESEEKIRETITKVIRKIPKIQSTLTLTRSESQEIFQTSKKIIEMILGQDFAQAYVVIHCKKGEEYLTLKNLSHISEVKEADVIFGFYDVICKIQASNNKILENIITKVIRALPHIESSMTLNIINEQENDIKKVSDTEAMGQFVNTKIGEPSRMGSK